MKESEIAIKRNRGEERERERASVLSSRERTLSVTNEI